MQMKIGCLAMLTIVPALVGGMASLTRAESPDPYANETPEQRAQRMKWWHEARFGMFIHWGVYAVPAGTYKGERISGIGEWIMQRGKIPVAEYREYAKEFNPVKYDPDAWVRLAKEAGMKYIVITSKHHDGFALFDSKVTKWDVVDATPYGKDLLKPLAEACRKHGMKLGFYYSQAQDWNHPGGAAAGGHWDPAQEGSMDDYIRDIAVPQVKEILTGYPDLAILWWDTPINMNKERAEMLLPLIRLRPGIITNDRLGGDYKGDLRTPEQHIPATGLDYDWETCMTMNNTWGFKSYDHDWKSTETLVRNLIDIASKGGNYLLNVGPTAEGEIPEPSVERLKEIGKWMDVNGEAIYATTASPFHRLPWGRCTKKVRDDGATLYFHVFDWPVNAKLRVNGLRSKVARASLLANGENLDVTQNDDGVVIVVPAKAPDPIATVIKVEVEGKLDVEPVQLSQIADGSVMLFANMADINNPGYGKHARLEGPRGQENVGRWTDPGNWLEWTFMLREAGKFDVYATVAAEKAGNRVEVQHGDQKFETEVRATGDAGKYERIRLGQIDIRQTGKQQLALRPVKDKWQGINLRSVELRPSPAGS